MEIWINPAEILQDDLSDILITSPFDHINATTENNHGSRDNPNCSSSNSSGGAGSCSACHDDGLEAERI
jgi:hypothetical protein